MENLPQEPEANDIGTRIQHLSEYADALEACAEIVAKRIRSDADRERLIKFRIAAELARHTVDNFSGYSKDTIEYKLYKILNGIPTKAEEINGGRGTPLAHDYEPWNDPNKPSS